MKHSEIPAEENVIEQTQSLDVRQALEAEGELSPEDRERGEMIQEEANRLERVEPKRIDRPGKLRRLLIGGLVSLSTMAAAAPRAEAGNRSGVDWGRVGTEVIIQTGGVIRERERAKQEKTAETTRQRREEQEAARRREGEEGRLRKEVELERIRAQKEIEIQRAKIQAEIEKERMRRDSELIQKQTQLENALINAETEEKRTIIAKQLEVVNGLIRSRLELYGRPEMPLEGKGKENPQSSVAGPKAEKPPTAQ
jgi:hypothetical protein